MSFELVSGILMPQQTNQSTSRRQRKNHKRGMQCADEIRALALSYAEDFGLKLLDEAYDQAFFEGKKAVAAEHVDAARRMLLAHHRKSTRLPDLVQTFGGGVIGIAGSLFVGELLSATVSTPIVLTTAAVVLVCAIGVAASIMSQP